jgi:hypothetical protein
MEDPFAKWRVQPVMQEQAGGDPFAKWRSQEAAPQAAPTEKPAPAAESVLPGWMQSVHETIAPDKVLGYPTMLALAIPGARAPNMGIPTSKPIPTPTPKVAPNTEYATQQQLKDMSQGLYKEAKEAGVEYTAPGYARLVAGLRHKMNKEGLRQDLHPDTYHAMQEMIKAIPRKPQIVPEPAMSKITGEAAKQPRPTKQTLDLSEIDTLRRVAGKAKRGFDPQKADDRRLAKIMTDRIDDWVGKPLPRDIAAGDPAKASASIKNARALWTRMRKTETLDKIQERALNRVGANYSNAGMQTALRQEFKNLANSNKMSRFSKEEQAVIRRIVRGASGENLLRWIGKFAPTSPMQAMVSMFVGAPGGVVGQAALMGAGVAARGASARMGASKVNELNALVRRGYTQGGASY